MPKITLEESLNRMERVLHLLEEEKTQQQIADIMGLSRSTISKTIKRARENREQILQREHRVWELRQRGATHQQIADEVGMERSTITKMLGRMVKRFLETLDDDVKRAKLEQWSQLDFMLAEVFTAWEQSKRPSQDVTRRQYIVGDLPKEADLSKIEARSTTVTTRVKEQGGGDLRYMREARAVMSDIRKLLGLDTPIKISQTDPSGEREAETPAQVLIYIPDNERDPNPAAARPADSVS